MLNFLPYWSILKPVVWLVLNLEKDWACTYLFHSLFTLFLKTSGTLISHRFLQTNQKIRKEIRSFIGKVKQHVYNTKIRNTFLLIFQCMLAGIFCFLVGHSDWTSWITSLSQNGHNSTKCILTKATSKQLIGKGECKLKTCIRKEWILAK